MFSAISDISEYVNLQVNVLDSAFTITSNETRYYPSLKIIVVKVSLESQNLTGNRYTPVEIVLPYVKSKTTALSVTASSSRDSYFSRVIGGWINLSNGKVTIDPNNVMFAQPTIFGVILF